MFLVQGAVGFCLAVQPTDGDIGTIGRKFRSVKAFDTYYKFCVFVNILFHLVASVNAQCPFLYHLSDMIMLCRELHDWIPDCI